MSKMIDDFDKLCKSESAPRCSRCRFYKEDWHPQPGVNWDRCTKILNADGKSSSCNINDKRDCKSFKRKFIILFTYENLWWKPYF